MIYLEKTIRVLVTLFVLFAVINSANSQFQNLIFAILGFSFAVLSFGVSTIIRMISKNAISNMRILTTIAQNIPNFKEEVTEHDWIPLNKAEAALEKSEIFYVIEIVTDFLIIACSLYLVFISL